MWACMSSCVLCIVYNSILDALYILTVLLTHFIVSKCTTEHSIHTNVHRVTKYG